MPRDASGNYSPPSVYLATPGTTIRAEQHNVPIQDMSQALTDSLPRNGSAPMTGPLQMGGRRILGAGNPTAATDAANKRYVDDAVTTSATVTPPRVIMDGAGLVGSETTTSGPSRRIFVGTGLEFNNGSLRTALGAGLSIVSGAVAAVVARFSTQAEATAGTNNDSAMTPLRTAQQIAASQVQASQVQVAGQRLVGRPDAGSGSATGVTLGAGLSFSGSSVVATVSRTATVDEARAGSENTAAMTPLNTLQFANANLLGMFQSWVDVSGSRSTNTTYTNNSGKPIMISVRAQSGQLQVAVPGSANWITVGAFEQNPDGRQYQTAIVPPLHVYRAQVNSILAWSELR